MFSLMSEKSLHCYLVYVKVPAKKLVAPVKDLTEDSLTKGLFTKELSKDGAASKDKQQWEESP